MDTLSRRASGSQRSAVVRVECHAGYRGEETPRRIQLAGSWLEIEEILDRWLAPDHRYFEVRCGDGETRLLRHDVESQLWELLPER
jgi:hypothetical protein